MAACEAPGPTGSAAWVARIPCPWTLGIARQLREPTRHLGVTVGGGVLIAHDRAPRSSAQQPREFCEGRSRLGGNVGAGVAKVVPSQAWAASVLPGQVEDLVEGGRRRVCRSSSVAAVNRSGSRPGAVWLAKVVVWPAGSDGEGWRRHECRGRSWVGR